MPCFWHNQKSKTKLAPDVYITSERLSISNDPLSFLFTKIRGISHFYKHKGKTGWDSKLYIQGRERLAAVCLVFFFAPFPWVPHIEHFMSCLSCEYLTPSVLCPLICYFGRKWEKWREFLNLLIFLFPLEEATECTNFPQNYCFLRRNSVFHPVLAAVGV